MNYSEALNLFGFTGEFTEENLRKNTFTLINRLFYSFTFKYN